MDRWPSSKFRHQVGSESRKRFNFFKASAPVDLYHIDNFNQSNIVRLSQQILMNYNFPESFINYCSIFIQIKKSKVYILIKFPLDSSRMQGTIYYFQENFNFDLYDALKSDEILHNGDFNYQGDLIKYSEFKDNEHKVSLKASPQDGISLAVLVRDDTYTYRFNSIVTEKRGNKEI